ncbi:MAG: HDOD domain-containing protein [Pseudomonadota bacterium]
MSAATKQKPDLASSPNIDLPARIGRFVPEKILGRGGQGVVYLAHDPKLERKVAIKTLLTNDAEPARLINEAKNVAKLNHPGIVPVYEIDTTSRSVYLVYQFVAGDSLGEWLNNNTGAKPKDIVSIIKQVLEAMAHAHTAGILHRDLSPANILIDANGNARILDFGVASIMSEQGQEPDMVGTMAYLPPECLSGGTVGAHSDVYSIAVLFHELLTRERLFDADSTTAIAYKIVNEKIVPPSVTNRAVEASLDEIVMTGLAREVDRRYQSAQEMLTAIDGFLNDKQQNAESDGEDGEYSSTIEFMLRRIARKPDFPAVSRYISEISQKTGSRGRSDASELADVILKDYALTSKLLRLVNSAVFGQYGGSISTVSRAVVILGFDQVRAAALSIAVFEHLQNGKQADALKDAACSSFLSAMLARSILEDQSDVDPEQAFIGAMFHQLGKHLTIYYFPEEYEEIKALMLSKGVDEDAAVQEILGTSYGAFGTAIGEQWNLPSSMVRCMKPLPAGEIKAASDPDGKLVEVTALANELAEICGTSDVDHVDQDLRKLAARFKQCIKLDTKTLKQKVSDAIQETREYANVLSVDLESADFFSQVTKNFGSDSESESETTAGTSASAAASTNALEKEATEEEPATPVADRKAFLVETITELTQAMLNNASANEILSMVVQSIYRGLGVTRVLLMIRDPKRHSMQARSGHGKDLDDILPHFSFKVSTNQDIFNQALRKGKEFIVLDVENEQYKALIPGWCKSLTNPSSILLFPIMVNGNCIGLIYADQQDAYAKISAEEFKLLVTLVQQAALAIQQRA